MMAFDHRRSLQDGLLDGDASLEQLASVKDVVFEGACRGRALAGARQGRIGVLVDARHGARVVVRARSEGFVVAVAVEASGADEVRLDASDRLDSVLDRLEPDYAKVLVRYNVGGDREANARQRATLARIATALAGRPLLLELLVPPTERQRRAVRGDLELYDAELRPELTMRAMAEIRSDGVQVAMWKIEGLETGRDAAEVAAAAGAPCLLLGRNAPTERLDHWLSIASATAGWEGFAVGRTIWWQPVREWLSGAIQRDAAVESIAAEFVRIIDVFEHFRPSPSPAEGRRG